MNNLQEAILELHKINNTHCFECLGRLNENITKIIKLLQEHPSYKDQQLNTKVIDTLEFIALQCSENDDLLSYIRKKIAYFKENK